MPSSAPAAPGNATGVSSRQRAKDIEQDKAKIWAGAQEFFDAVLAHKEVFVTEVENLSNQCREFIKDFDNSQNAGEKAAA